MTIGYNEILKMRRIEAVANSLGFMFAYPQFRNSTESAIALIPKDSESLPIYSRDTQIYSGTLDELDNFILGIQWSRSYDRMLRLSNEKSRERKERNIRNQNLLQTLKNS